MRDAMRMIKKEDGSAAILEYSIVLPLCLFLLVLIFMAGYVLNQKAVLDSAAERAVMITQKIYTDPNYLELVELTDDPDDKDYVGYKARRQTKISDLESDPYRYWNNGYKGDIIQSKIAVKVENIVRRNQLIDLSSILTSDIKTEVSPMTGIIFKKQSVKVTQEITVPVLKIFAINPKMTLVGESSITVTQPSELIRNSHFALNVMEDAWDIVGQKVSDKLKVLFDKITDFFHKG